MSRFKKGKRAKILGVISNKRRVEDRMIMESRMKRRGPEPKMLRN